MVDGPEMIGFDELGLGFGQMLTLFPDPSDKSLEYECMLVGCLPGESLMVGPPESGVLPRLEEGQKVYIRIKLAAGVALFPAIVLFVGEIPTIMVYLDFPESIKFKRVRGALRVKVALPILANNVTDERYTVIAGKIVDISTSGAGIEVSETLGSIGDTVELKGKFEVAKVQRVLVIPAIIRSHEERDTGFVYGVEFSSADEDSLLVLFGFIFHAMAYKQIESIR